MKNNRSKWLLFFIGCFSMTQIRVGGNIGISELFVFLAAPLIFITDYRRLSRHGFLPTLYLAILVCIACVISSAHNHTPLYNVIRGFASPYGIFAWVVVLHRLLTRNIQGFKFFIIGLALSSVINIFVFQPGREIDGSLHGANDDAVEAVISSQLFWVQRLTNFLTIPIRCWYLETPILYSILAPLFIIAFTFATTESGRSASLATMVGCLIIFFCQKSRRKIIRVERQFITFAVLCGLVVVIFKIAYVYMGSQGLLNEKAEAKFERQSRFGTSAHALLIGGRAEFFCGLTAALERPIIGYGPWAVDTSGFYENFLLKYGNETDFASYLRYRESMAKSGFVVQSLIPTHSHIVGFWVYYGCIGLIFWAYIVFLCVEHMRKYLSAVPQFLGLISFAIPSTMWHIFFSPFNSRPSTCFFIVILLIARAVGKGLIPLPEDMVRSAYEHDRL